MNRQLRDKLREQLNEQLDEQLDEQLRWRLYEQQLGGQRVQHVRCLTAGCRREEKTTLVSSRTGVQQEFRESVRLFSRGEMTDMMEAVGFQRILSFGSLGGEPFGPGSKRLVMVATKEDL